MTERFLNEVSHLIDIEGGFVDHPSDTGGATKYGISLAFYRSIKPYATAEDIRRLTKEDARNLYFQHFWKPGRCDSLPEGIGEAHFTNLVNMRPNEAAKILQRAINRTGRTQIMVDGVVGPKTITAAGKCNPLELKRRLVSETCMFYHRLANANPVYERDFLNGWFYRAASLFI